jgi:hypothetical protein
MVMMLEAGNYSVNINLGRMTSTNQGIPLHELPPLGPIALRWDYASTAAPFLGQFGLPVECRFSLGPIEALGG